MKQLGMHHLDTNYVLTVKSKNEREIKHTHFGNKEYLLAKRDSKYTIHAHNKSDYECYVMIVTGGNRIGRWLLKEKSTLIIKTDKEDKEFVFEDNYHHIISGLPDEDTCTHSSIAAVFESEYRPYPVVIKVPVLICEHTV